MSVTVNGEKYVGVCVDLFSGTESFSQAFRDSDDWFVVSVELDAQFSPTIQADVRDVSPTDIRDAVLDATGQDIFVEGRFQTDPTAHIEPGSGQTVDRQPDDPLFALVVLASPPCTTFSRASMGKYWRQTGPDEYAPKTPKSRRRVALTHHTLYLIHSLQPDYWFLENPVGMMKHVIDQDPEIVTWCQYGDDVQKPTYLFGDIPETFDVRACNNGDDCHIANSRGDYNFQDSETKSRQTRKDRAAIPEGLSIAIRDAVSEAWPPEYPDANADDSDSSQASQSVDVQSTLGATW